MKVFKAIGFLCLAAGAVFGFRLALGFAMGLLVAGERPQPVAVAAAPAPAMPTLAPAVSWPAAEPAEPETPAPNPSESPAERAFGAPEPGFGQANPALAHPATPQGGFGEPASEQAAGTSAAE